VVRAETKGQTIAPGLDNQPKDKTMTTTYTPTPWRVTATAFGKPHIESVDGAEVCKLFSDDAEGRATAAHIVHCVNAHDELVATLEAVKDAAIALEIDHRSRWGETSTTTILRKRIAKSIAALARAKGGS